MFLGSSPYLLFPVKLEVAALQLKTPRELELAQILAEETEVQREKTRSEFPDAPPNKDSIWLLGQTILGTSYSYADSLRWETLLTFGNCVSRCAARAQIPHPNVIKFAHSKCAPAEPWQLFWFEQWLLEIGSETIDAHLLAKYQRMKQGAVAGGLKSARTRQAKAKTPPTTKLNAERERLIAGGKEPSAVAGILASKYQVTPQAIRKRLAGK